MGGNECAEVAGGVGAGGQIHVGVGRHRARPLGVQRGFAFFTVPAGIGASRSGVNMLEGAGEGRKSEGRAETRDVGRLDVADLEHDHSLTFACDGRALRVQRVHVVDGGKVGRRDVKLHLIVEAVRASRAGECKRQRRFLD